MAPIISLAVSIGIGVLWFGGFTIVFGEVGFVFALIVAVVGGSLIAAIVAGSRAASEAARSRRVRLNYAKTTDTTPSSFKRD